MPRKTRFDGKKQRPKHDPNRMSDWHFELGDIDGGYDNWMPCKDKDYNVDKTQLANKTSMKALLPEQGSGEEGDYE